jgi:hypothetical protein
MRTGINIWDFDHLLLPGLYHGAINRISSKFYLVSIAKKTENETINRRRNVTLAKVKEVGPVSSKASKHAMLNLKISWDWILVKANGRSHKY